MESGCESTKRRSTVLVWVKLHDVPVTASSYARAMIELRADVELKDKIMDDMLKIIEEGYYTCNIRVEYERKPPSGGNKKKNVEPTNEVSKSNSFDALNSVDNDVELGTNGDLHMANQEANYSRSSFWNVESSSPRKPVRKDDNDNEEDVASVDNKMANFLAKDDGYGTQSLLEQWKYSHDDYEYVPYDDDLYDGPEMLQAFCDNLDIRVRGRCRCSSQVQVSAFRHPGEEFDVIRWGKEDLDGLDIQAAGKPVSEHVLEMKGLMDQLHTLGKPYDNDMDVNLINRSFNKDFGDFVRNFNMHCVEKTVTELHALLVDFEKGLKDKAPTP
uniref:DUF4283 domain-containing protein n=1 Tax=Tanacetum cinerariifolium TaxID=118510 RepID=A0A6L2MY45_TANCI|nr:hypothetical protein [Tanacetum cinerariifolium]